MRDKVLLLVTILFLVVTFFCTMNYDVNKNIKVEMSSSSDTEAVLIEDYEGYAGDIII